MNKILVFIFIVLFSHNSFSEQFKIGDPGYLMKACEEASKLKKTFESGYCFGVFNVVSAKLLKMDNAWDSYCSTETHTDVKVATIAKHIKENPNSWRNGDDYILVEQALKKYYPCNLNNRY